MMSVNRLMTWMFLGVSVTTLGGQVETEELRVTHRERAVAPGEVLLVEVRAGVPLREVAAELGGQTADFYSLDPQHWQALVPIDLEERPGRRILGVEGVTLTGRRLHAGVTLTVARRVFPTRRIAVEAKFADPPAEARQRIADEREKVEALFATTTRTRFWTQPFMAPVPGNATSSFGRRSIVNGEPRSPHTGTDFQAATGTPVVAPNDGRIVLAADLYFAGNTIIIDHGLGVYSYLGHLSAFDVEEGTVVKRGQRIARSGATGRVTGPHLHWTLRLGAARVDPLSLLAAWAPPSATK
jgi:hypothetical protein